MRTVDTYEYVTMLRELTESGKEVNLLISGSSMAPFLCHNRDVVYFKKPDRPLKRGDIVFFQRANGQYVLHRILRQASEGFYIIGDGQTEIEGPITQDQIFGLVTCVKRKGQMIGPGDFWWNFFAGFWLRHISLRHFLVKLYGKLKKRKA